MDAEEKWSITGDDYHDVACELLKICGCISNEVVEIFWDEIKKCGGENRYDSSILSQLVRVHLDNIGLVTHGTSIRGAFLTTEGEAVEDILHALRFRT